MKVVHDAAFLKDEEGRVGDAALGDYMESSILTTEVIMKRSWNWRRRHAIAIPRHGPVLGNAEPLA